MILDRLYCPSDDELIYHYCQPNAFIEIVESRSLRLSASYTLNDATERRWGYSIFTKTAHILEHQLGDEFIKKISVPVIAGDLYSMLMIGCFSLDADVLSQWRAYADNGRGFAIGFSLKLMHIPAKPLRVLYDEDAQIQELIGNLKHTYEMEKSVGFRYGDDFQSHLYKIGLDLCAYKNPAFREEREIRLAHFCGVDRKAKKVLSVGARAPDGKRLSEPLKTHFRMSNAILVPYVITLLSGSLRAILQDRLAA